jgi:hypothetical protein
MDVRLSKQLLLLVPDLARASGVTDDRELAGLVRLHLRCASEGVDQVAAIDVFGAWGLAPDEADRFLSAHVSRGVLVSGAEGWIVPSCTVYARIRAAQREAGKKSRSNLRQYSKAPASTSSSKSGPAAPSTPAPRSRELSAQEACWDYLDHLRTRHCVLMGLEPGTNPRPKLCNAKLNEACAATGIVDQIIEGQVFTRWNYLGLLFEDYLAGELGREKDGQLRSPPWPIELFLSPGVLRVLKEKEERAA